MDPFGASEIGKVVTEDIAKNIKELPELNGTREIGGGIRDIPKPTAERSEFPDRYEHPIERDIPHDIPRPDDIPLPDVIYSVEGQEVTTRPLTQEERADVKDKTGMSDATLDNCTIDNNGEIHLKCINEDKAGVPGEVEYKEKIIEVNGVKIHVVEPEFKGSKFETYLPPELQKATDAEQFSHCTKQLGEAIDKDPELAKQFSSEQLEQIKNGDARIKGYTWHHCDEPGKMQLVSTEEHVANRHTGGKVIWGGGQDNR